MLDMFHFHPVLEQPQYLLIRLVVVPLVEYLDLDLISVHLLLTLRLRPMRHHGPVLIIGYG